MIDKDLIERNLFKSKTVFTIKNKQIKVNNKIIEKLVEVLKNNGVVSVPTDTVYGLCATTKTKEAYINLYNLKQRKPDKPFPIMCLDLEQIKEIAHIGKRESKIINKFMPGPLTLILNKKEGYLDYLEESTIAVRLAPSLEIRELITKVGYPLFMTSANISGQEVCKSIEEIKNTFPNIDGILEGKIIYGIPSTIIDCTGNEIKLVREGFFSIEDLK